MPSQNSNLEKIIWTILGLFLVGYLLSWYNSYSLSRRFLREADAAYARGDYLASFMGSEEIKPETGQRVKYGGYYNVVNIWRDGYAWPKPPMAGFAERRIREVIASHLSIADGELFVQENVGRNNPYFADVYLRLGELYEASGDKRTALEIYRDVIKLFPERKDISQEAGDHLTALQKTP